MPITIKNMACCETTVYSIPDFVCALPTLVDLGNGEAVLNDGYGTLYFIPNDEIESASYDEVAQILSLTKRSGDVVQVSLPDTFLTSGTVDPLTNIMQLMLNDGSTVDVNLSALGGTDTFVTSITFNPLDNLFTLTNNDGSIFTTELGSLDKVSVMIDNGDGSYSHTSDGITTHITPSITRYSEIIPAGTTTIDVTHNLNTISPFFQLRDVITNQVVVHDSAIILTTNTTMLTFVPALQYNTVVTFI